ncbi:MAG: hypothetical protein ACRDRA_14440 [Pseudonocardiaceae bacterium]
MHRGEEVRRKIVAHHGDPITPAVQLPAAAQRGEQLPEQEWIPFATRSQLQHAGLRSGVKHVLTQRGHCRVVERTQRHPASSLGDQPVQGFLGGLRGSTDRTGTPRQYPQHRRRGQRRDQQTQRLRGEFVYPVGIVQHDHQPAVLDAPLDMGAQLIDLP